jgi:hypothetical protein
MTYLVHGDPVALAALAARITAEKQWPAHIAAHHERVESRLTAGGLESLGLGARG